ncbi:MAG: dihydrofolate reductase [Chloroflexi bacterium]|nr:dihydrofolate reductase [Chloroflexota bacterium]
MKALILAPFWHEALEKLGKKMEVIYESWMDTNKLLSAEEFIERIQSQDIQIVVVEADFITREVFERAKKLKFLGVCRADMAYVDVKAATEHRVLVVNTPGRNAAAVAELTVGLMLALLRHIPKAHQIVSSGNWIDPTTAYFSLRGGELNGKTIGIVGFGAIGRRVAKLVGGFDAFVLAYDPFVDANEVKKAGAQSVELDDLMQRSDIVTLHASTAPGAIGLISAQRIALMKPTAYLINAANAFVIDNEAIIRALQERRIAGAAFDVFETWPVRPDSPLLKLDNVVLTPHIGGATEETIVRHSQMIVEDIKRFSKGERPRNLVNPQAWRKSAR